MSIEQWRLDAACTGEDPDLFFPLGTAGPALEQVQRAKQVCSVCPGQGPCLTWALAIPDLHGIWGGTTEEERRLHRRRLLGVEPAPTAPAPV